MDKVKSQLGANVGALSGLGKKIDSEIEVNNEIDSNNVFDNRNDNQNNNINDNRNINDGSNSTGTDIASVEVAEPLTVEDKLLSVKQRPKKRIKKNVTFGLYEDQQKTIKKIAKAYDITVNELMRTIMDDIIEVYMKDLENK